MGQSQSVSRVHATVAVPSAAHRLDEIRLTRRRVTCCGAREKSLAIFTFPSHGWLTTPEGVSECVSARDAAMPLHRLRRQDAETPVLVTAMVGGAAVLRVGVPLAGLLQALAGGPEGGWASALNFVFSRLDALPEAPRPSGNYNALYCNGRLCGVTNGDWLGSGQEPPVGGKSHTPPPVESTQTPPPVERTQTPPPVERTQTPESQHSSLEETAGVAKIPRVVFPGPSEAPVKPSDYQVRLIVHRVDDMRASWEVFPDIYVKARMRNPPGEWRRTDVHVSSVKQTALFEYRLILPPFTYPARARNKKILPPTLEVVLMDEDKNTRDDYLSSIELNLEELILPSDRQGCGVPTLSNRRVNLFEGVATYLRRPDAVFPREVTGYWPLVKKKFISRQLKSTGSALMTIQLLTAKEAAAYPAVQGNRRHPGNRYPTLQKPSREHGSIANWIFMAPLHGLERVVTTITGLPSLSAAVWCVVIVAYVCYRVQPAHLKLAGEAVSEKARWCFAEYPAKSSFFIFYYLVAIVAFVYVKRGCGRPSQAPQEHVENRKAPRAARFCTSSSSRKSRLRHPPTVTKNRIEAGVSKRGGAASEDRRCRS